jgi:hypothetical protein
MSRRMVVFGCQSGKALRRLAKSLAKKWATRSSAIKSRNAQGICEMQTAFRITQAHTASDQEDKRMNEWAGEVRVGKKEATGSLRNRLAL